MKSHSARFDCAVIGGGAAGMFAAITAAAGGLRVALLEPNERLGKKLGITGKGRCNVTNHCTPEEALQQIPRGGRFLMSALHRFTPEDTMEFFESRRCPLKTERGNRVFPVSDRSFDIVDVLRRELREPQLLRVQPELQELRVQPVPRERCRSAGSATVQPRWWWARCRWELRRSCRRGQA